MNNLSTDDAIQLTCAHCHSHFRVQSRASLKPGAKSSCASCGTRFVVVTGPALHTSPASSPQPAVAPPSTDQDTESTSLQPTIQPPTVGPKTYRLSFFGLGGSLFGMHLVNVCLTILTLGLYSFWAKVKVRRYLYSQTQCAGDRFAYHGTARELLNGAGKATLLFGLPYLVLSMAPRYLGIGGAMVIAGQVLATLLFMFFLPVAVTGARRYRLSRSSWRGIHFSFHGRALEFSKLFLTGSLLTALTLGAYYPLFEVKRQAYLINHSYLGTQRFSFDGDHYGIARSFVGAMLLLPFTLGCSWFWYIASRQRYFWNHSTFCGGRFVCTVQGWPLFRLKLGNVLLLLCSLGLAWPWTTVRNTRFLFGNLHLKGAMAVEHIRQDQLAATATGEGLSSFLDTGFDLG
jgi:uncharacterized membrane protein YjgN (DUF898 family)